jgi:hypothetical protein
MKYKIQNNKINEKIYIIGQILDILDGKLYKYFPSKRLIKTKQKLNDRLFELYIYGE